MSGPSILLTSSQAGLFDDLPFTEALCPLMEITAAVVNAGYPGVRVIEFQLMNGRYVQRLDVQKSTPAGRYMAELAKREKAGKPLPTIHEALATLARRSSR
jgi:hypothetical protein